MPAIIAMAWCILLHGSAPVCFDKQRINPFSWDHG
jgi:hypothetical protein